MLLSGGNPQIAKGEGNAPVQAYIKAVPGWKRALARRLHTSAFGVAAGDPAAHQSARAKDNQQLPEGSAAAEDRSLHLSVGDPARKDREAPLVLDGITDAPVVLLRIGDVQVKLESARTQESLVECIRQVGGGHRQNRRHDGLATPEAQLTHEPGLQSLVGRWGVHLGWPERPAAG